jgi:outer membrane protein assembly factor BamA
MGLKSHFPQSTYYLDGSNNSKKEEGLITPADSNFMNAVLDYVLPIGEGLHNPDNAYHLRNGFAEGREGYGNGMPFVTGRTTLSLKAFYQKDTFDNASSPKIQSWETNGLRFALTHDNTDFDLNPSRGYHFNLQYSADYGQGDSSQSWDFLEFKYNHYISLDTFSFTKQNILAMSVWTGHSFSWDNNEEIYPNINGNRPPLWDGGRLGGMFRMRGYDSNRFSDKSVFYATAEYRAVLDYNPLKDNSLVPVAVDWFQVVAFVEAGRVNDNYNFDLLTDMKYDVGLSLRSMVAQLPIRFDVAVGEEGTNMWVMINQPFDF